jgi:hypothetical protein
MLQPTVHHQSCGRVVCRSSIPFLTLPRASRNRFCSVSLPFWQVGATEQVQLATDIAALKVRIAGKEDQELEDPPIVRLVQRK